MATRKDDNFDTQELTEDSQEPTQYFSFQESQEQIRNWGTLEMTKVDCKIVQLKSGVVHFGRAFGNVPYSGEQREILTRKEIPEELDFQRISSHHFTISLLTKDEKTGFVYEESSMPAIIICKGRNGLIVDEVQLAQEEKKVLKHSSVIRLVKSRSSLCRFMYSWGTNDKLTTSTNLIRNYFIGQMIGSGGCGSVNIVLPLRKKPVIGDFRAMALKSIIFNSTNTLTGSSSQQQFKGIMNEVRIMQNLKYHHVMGLADHFVTARKVHLLFEFMGGGDLLSRITNSKMKYLEESEAKFFFNQLLLGVEYLHRIKITHRDIKPDNVFLSDKSDKPLLKIGDFGLSKMDYVMNTKCGTLIYAAPEIIENISSYTHKVDIWSLGCLLYALLSGKVPFQDGPRLTYNISTANYSMENLKKNSEAARAMIRSMLRKFAFSRPEAKEMLENAWFTMDQRNEDRMNDLYRKHGLENEDNSLTNELERTLVIDEEQEKRESPRRYDEDDDGEISHNAKRQRLN